MATSSNFGLTFKLETVNPLAYAVERAYSVPRARLWQAWTDAGDLAEWYCPLEMRVLPGSTISDPVEGGKWCTAVDAGAYGVAYFWGRYAEVEPTVRITHTLHYSTDVADFDRADETGPTHVVVLEFSDTASGAHVRYSQFGEMPAEEAGRAQAGMESYLDSLAQFLARRPG